MLGAHVVYRALAAHHTTTVVGHEKDDKGEHKLDEKGNKIPIEVHGSIHHRELKEFAGLVTRVHPSGKRGVKDTYDIVIFPPGKEPVHVESVSEGKGDHEIMFPERAAA